MSSLTRNAAWNTHHDSQCESSITQAQIGTAADSEFTAALLHHQQRAVSSGMGSGCKQLGFARTHTPI